MAIIERLNSDPNSVFNSLLLTQASVLHEIEVYILV